MRFSPVFPQVFINDNILGRIGIAAQMVGLAQGAFDKAVPYTYERKQFGQPVGTFQGMAFQIAQAAIDLESARLLTFNAARRKEEGRSFTKEAAMAKYWASVVAQRISGQAIEWAGGVGFTRETGIEKYWRDSKIVSLSPVRPASIGGSVSSDIEAHIACRVLSTREHPTSNYRLSPSLFRKNTHKTHCMNSTTIGANLYHDSEYRSQSCYLNVCATGKLTGQYWESVNVCRAGVCGSDGVRSSRGRSITMGVIFYRKSNLL